MVQQRRNLTIFTAAYWKFLLQGWKVSTFLIAAIGMTVIAPYTGDPTWDYFDAAYMSILAFTTAPWAVGTLYCGLLRRASLSHIYVAVCVWMFSASWSYDLYLLLRDGYYPVTWLSNIFASSVLYVCAGLTWNLERHPRRGIIFGFMDPAWPQLHPSDFRYLVWYALPFMILVAAIIMSFLI